MKRSRLRTAGQSNDYCWCGLNAIEGGRSAEDVVGSVKKDRPILAWDGVAGGMHMEA